MYSTKRDDFIYIHVARHYVWQIKIEMARYIRKSRVVLKYMYERFPVLLVMCYRIILPQTTQIERSRDDHVEMTDPFFEKRYIFVSPSLQSLKI